MLTTILSILINPSIFLSPVAQELLNDWMNSKLRLELASDIEEDVGESAGDSNPSKAPLVGFMKYERFDGESITKPFLTDRGGCFGQADWPAAEIIGLKSRNPLCYQAVGTT